ncbi:MAG: stalk domain-containing protein [Acidobacteriota bacterium]
MIKSRWLALALLVLLLLSVFPGATYAALLAPINLSQTAISYNSVSMSWSYDNTSGLDSFQITRSLGDGSQTVSLADVPASQKTYTDNTVAPDTIYLYTVRACSNASGSLVYSGYSNQMCARTLLAPPAKPASITATLSPEGFISLTWPAVLTATSYQIERSTNSNCVWSDYSSLTTVDGNTLGYVDASAVLNGWYIYRVQAISANGKSDYTSTSQIHSVITAPASPSPLTTVISGTNQIHLAWKDSSNASVVQIHRKKGLGDFSCIKSYDRFVEYKTYDDTVTPGTYTYKIRVENRLGNNTSNESSITVETYSAASDGPTAPANLAATVNGTATNLTWEDRSSDEESFQIWRKVYDSDFINIANVGANATSYSDTGLTLGTDYTYRVRAANSTKGTFSIYSNEVIVTAGKNTPIRPTPTVIPRVTPTTPTTTTTSTSATRIRLYLNNTSYLLNNDIKRLDAAPISKNGRTLLPISYVASALGATTEWYPTDKKAVITFKGKVIILWVGRNMAQVDGTVIPIDPDNSTVVPITVPPGRTMMPLRFVAEQLGCKLNWNPISKEIEITYPK